MTKMPFEGEENNTSLLPGEPYDEQLEAGLIVRVRAIQGITSKRASRVLPFTFHVAPSGTFPISRSFPHNDYEPLAGKQRSREGVTALRSASWTALFLDWKPNWSILRSPRYRPNPLEMLEKLEIVGEEKKAVLLTARNPALWERYDVNWPATLRELNSEEREGEPDARYATLTFVEWIATALNTKRIGTTSRLPVSLTAKTLPAGRDTLYELARIYYGDQGDWRIIAKANGLQVPPTYDLNKLGNRKIRVPRRP